MGKKLNLPERKITDLVGENHVYASVLYYMGIQFFDYKTETLAQVCESKGLSLDHVIANLENVNKNDDSTVEGLISYPADLIIEYLRHTHYLFIKKDLPFIARLIEKTTVDDPQVQAILDDLKTVFPLFVEDFVEHIYEEEDQLFSYILHLNMALKKQGNINELLFSTQNVSLEKFAAEHEVHDDVMDGIRKITNNYAADQVEDLNVKVLYNELHRFEQKLIIHANVENEVLFPKAFQLEQEVKQMRSDLANNN